MSSCRCSDIEKCKSQLDELQKNLQFVYDCDVKFDNMKDNMKLLISYNNNAFISLDPLDLNSKTQEIGDELIEIIDQIKEKIRNKMDELRVTLERLQEEDDDFHAEEDVNDMEREKAAYES